MDGPEHPADQGLLAAVLGALRGSGYRAVGSLRCEVEGGVVTVSGVVPSYHLKQVAQAALLRLRDIKGVRNLVEVRRDRDG
jgi:hypothetical protein